MTRILVNTLLIAFTVFSSTMTLILVMLTIEKILEPHIKNASIKELAVLGIIVLVLLGVDVYLLRKFWKRNPNEIR